ncbi:MAG: beta-hydroxyacyl-ACP dehydratase [Phycisphaerales bacterium]|nr:beta-hydroxyacyl-ACP dehydratase [Phycisphaerales bacterium]
MWIDRIVELIPRERLVAVKNVSLAEGHLHDHFAAGGGRGALPIMPASLIIEGMAQAAGILVGHAEGFRENVILAKVSLAELDADAGPGDALRYTAVLRQFDGAGASTEGTVERRLPQGGWEPIGRIDLMFSHVGAERAGPGAPAGNFVFGESFKTLLRLSGF